MFLFTMYCIFQNSFRFAVMTLYCISSLNQHTDRPQLKKPSHSRQITIIEGNPLQLDCMAVGNPGPSYTWTLPLTGSSPSNNGTLIIQSVAVKDKGRYTCSVSNDVGNITVDYDVDVQGEFKVLSCPVFRVMIVNGK